MKLIENKPIGTQRVWAHLNYGSRDPRTGFQWVDWPEYSKEDTERAERFYSHFRDSKLTLREAGALLGMSAADLSSVLFGRARFESEAAEAEAAKLLRKGKTK